MGLLEKLKNTFFEEEYVEVEEPEKPVKEKKQKEVVAKKIVEEPKVEEKKEEIVVEEPKVEEKHEILTEKELLKPETNFKYFEDDDFVDEEVYDSTNFNSKEEKKSSYNIPSYGISKEKVTTTYTKTTEKVFKPTPIISPIYGILDKNYTKDEIPEKKEIKPSSSYVSRRGADLDSIRRKAYGDMAGDFDKQEEVVEEDKEEPVEENLLYDMTDIDTTPAVEKVTLADAEEYFTDLGLEYNVDYKDSKYEKSMGRRVNKTPDIDAIDAVEDEEEKEDDELPLESALVTDIDEEQVVEDVEIPIEEEPITEEEVVAVEEPSENEKLEDNLFELIDSMYEDKE